MENKIIQETCMVCPTGNFLSKECLTSFHIKNNILLCFNGCVPFSSSAFVSKGILMCLDACQKNTDGSDNWCNNSVTGWAEMCPKSSNSTWSRLHRWNRSQSVLHDLVLWIWDANVTDIQEKDHSQPSSVVLSLKKGESNADLKTR